MISSQSPSGLRQRQKTPSPAPADKGAVPAALQHVSRGSSKVSRYLLGLVSLALSTTYFYSQYHPSAEFRASHYALCSSDGANIYTVDADKPNVQCIVVQDGHFVDAGSLGKPSVSRFLRNF